MDQGYLNLVKAYGGSRLQVYRLVKIPSAMISLLSGLKVAATYSISGAVVGEWIASQSGLGYYLIRAKNGFMLDRVFACVLMIIVLSLLMNGLVKLFGWAVLPMERRAKAGKQEEKIPPGLSGRPRRLLPAAGIFIKHRTGGDRYEKKLEEDSGSDGSGVFCIGMRNGGLGG